MGEPKRSANSDLLNVRLRGSLWAAVLSEFFSNSAHFAFTNIVFESLREGLWAYLREPDLYSMLFAVTLQSYVLGRADHTGRPIHFLGNLIAPAVYSAIELAFEGPAFFAGQNHVAFWIFAIAIGTLRSIRSRSGGRLGDILVICENVVRAAFLAAMYWLFEMRIGSEVSTLQGFLQDPSHVFVIIVVPMLGALLGVMSVVAMRRMTVLADTAGHLRNLSEWTMGRDLVSRAVADPGELELQRRERVVIFMDIRGFTRWSEGQTPDAVVGMLNAYFRAAESVWARYEVVIARLIADEIFLVVASADAALDLAGRMRAAALDALRPYGLSAGIGVNSGQLIEGMIGSGAIRVYDVIGDTVNTGARFCSVAAGGEVLVAEHLVKAVGERYQFGAARHIEVKGKSGSLTVHPLLDGATN